MVKRIVVSGSRDFNDYDKVKEYIELCISNIKGKYELIFVSGGCRGVDMLGERYAEENGFKMERYIANWNKYGKRAGPERNKYMAEISDYIICFWDYKSKGTKSMINYAKLFSKPIRIKRI